jgi:hypothetical protein
LMSAGEYRSASSSMPRIAEASENSGHPASSSRTHIRWERVSRKTTKSNTSYRTGSGNDFRCDRMASVVVMALLSPSSVFQWLRSIRHVAPFLAPRGDRLSAMERPAATFPESKDRDGRNDKPFLAPFREGGMRGQEPLYRTRTLTSTWLRAADATECVPPRLPSRNVNRPGKNGALRPVARDDRSAVLSRA